jgi:hypothetical protein
MGAKFHLSGPVLVRTGGERDRLLGDGSAVAAGWLVPYGVEVRVPQAV